MNILQVYGLPRSRSVIVTILFSLCLVISMSGNTRESSLAINFVEVTGKLHTAGQPDEERLGQLSQLGYNMVINLAPPTSRGSIETEGKLVADQGIVYVNIPVDWQNPQYTDFDLFRGVLSKAGDRKVLVHCQMNMRVSVFTFLYRVIEENTDPQEAYEYVRKVWEPIDHWKTFANKILSGHGIKYEL